MLPSPGALQMALSALRSAGIEPSKRYTALHLRLGGLVGEEKHPDQSRWWVGGWGVQGVSGREKMHACSMDGTSHPACCSSCKHQ
jgi:hypothetical protein